MTAAGPVGGRAAAGGRDGLVAAATGPALLVVAGAAMLSWTWRTWMDPVVDFGRELYVPWRLNEGEVLGRDIAWFNGPLSQHVNALWFRLFGTGFMTLAVANLAILAATVAMAWRLLARIADRAGATAACLLFLLVFAFGQHIGIANFNWIAPYSHEATHGLALALATLGALDAWARGGRWVWLAAGGAALGLAFLTKPETFLAAGAAAAVLLAPALRARRLRELALFGVSALAPAAIATGLLAGALGIGGALRVVAGAWPSLIEGEVSRLPFYRRGMGVDAPVANAMEMARWAGKWLLVLAPAAALSFLKRGSPRAGRAIAAGLAAAIALVLLRVRSEIDWSSAGRPLPLFAAVIAVALAIRGRGGAPLALAALALALLLKIGLNARVAHYGFTLALPATMLVTVALVSWIPAWLERRGAHGVVMRAGALALLGTVAAVHLELTRPHLARKTTIVGSGRDAFRADVRGRFVNDSVRSLLDSGARSLAVLPEGIVFNWLARVRNPTPFVNFMPPELILFGEEAWLDAFRAAPPDVILLVHKDTSEYGYPLFGRDYGARLMAWIRAEYRPVGLLGQEPLQPGTTLFGVRALAHGRQ